jgi:hypothetical protein
MTSSCRSSADNKYLADHISGATYVEGKGADHMYWLGNQDETLNAI